MDFSEIIQEVKEAMFKNSIVPPEEIIIDGHFHRFHIQGSKAVSKDGWYIIYHDVIPCGAFGDWKESQSIKWCFKKQGQLSKKERAHFKLQMAKAMRQRIAVRLEEQAKASMSASSLHLKSSPANPQHPYLSRKRIKPFFARQQDDLLVLPIRDFSGKLWSLQFVNINGKKWFLPNGAISGHFIPIQLNTIQQGTKILLCEGFATGATLASAYPDACVIAACNAGNLKPVAINIRQQLPNVTIVICADDDRLSLKNIGVIKGQEAAIAVGGCFIKPEWPEGSPNTLTDFNDLECWLLSQEEAAA
jgi:putative DNA primase/helicase